MPFENYRRSGNGTKLPVDLWFCNPKGIAQQSPGLRGTSYPGCGAKWRSTPTGLWPRGIVVAPSRNPFRVVSNSRTYSQGSSFLATLGFVAESLWDSDSEFRKAAAKA